jgi:hypothetical protein
LVAWFGGLEGGLMGGEGRQITLEPLGCLLGVMSPNFDVDMMLVVPVTDQASMGVANSPGERLYSTSRQCRPCGRLVMAAHRVGHVHVGGHRGDGVRQGFMVASRGQRRRRGSLSGSAVGGF